jgi:hypothetical protein
MSAEVLFQHPNLFRILGHRDRSVLL